MNIKQKIQSAAVICLQLMFLTMFACSQTNAQVFSIGQFAFSPKSIFPFESLLTDETSPIVHTSLMKDAKFAAELRVKSGGAMNVGKSLNFVFTVKDLQGNPVKNLQVVHEKLMHVMIISDDLSIFDHVHPVLQPDGSFLLDYKFTSGGKYKIYVDYTPQNSGQVVDLFDVDVVGKPYVRQNLVTDTNFTKTIDNLTFTFKPDKPLQTGSGILLGVYVKDSTGKPVTNLQKYLGALAHFVIISEDRSKFLHAHPLDTDHTEDGEDDDHKVESSNKKSETEKPTVQAHTEFPIPGLYKMWAQFQYNGKVIVVPFVFRVADNPDAKIEQNQEFPKDAVKVTISGQGYEPSSINVQKGALVKLAFYRADANNCGGEVVFPKLNIRRTLPVGKIVTVEFTPTETGEISFACGMNMYHGKIIVTD